MFDDFFFFLMYVYVTGVEWGELWIRFSYRFQLYTRTVNSLTFWIFRNIIYLYVYFHLAWSTDYTKNIYLLYKKYIYIVCTRDRAKKCYRKISKKKKYTGVKSVFNLLSILVDSTKRKNKNSRTIRLLTRVYSESNC